jgi:hypothetical protein
MKLLTTAFNEFFLQENPFRECSNEMEGVEVKNLIKKTFNVADDNPT